MSSVATLSAAQAPRLPIGSGRPVVLSLAVWCSISLLSSVYLLRSAGFLMLYFLALWAIVRWDTHRRAARLIDRWKSADAADASRAALSLPNQLIDWLVLNHDRD